MELTATTFKYNDREIKSLVHENTRYFNMQSMADSCGSTKRVRSFLALDTTQEYIKSLQKHAVQTNDKKNVFDNSNAVYTKKGGDVKSGAAHDSGTWVHEELLICAARWLDSDFAVSMDMQYREYLRNGFLISAKINAEQTAKLEREVERHKIKHIKALQIMNELNFEHEAHKCFSHLYTVVARNNICAEAVFNDSRFDFLERRSDCVIVTELKAKMLTQSVIEHELANVQGCKNYLRRAAELFAQYEKPVRIKFLAPQIHDNCAIFLGKYKTNWLSFELKTWTDEIDWLIYRYEQQKHCRADCDRVFTPVINRLRDIRYRRFK